MDLSSLGVALGGPVIGGIAGLLGQNKANKVNKEIAHEFNEYNRENMYWMQGRNEMMSNTAWQRGVSDMRKAGINPMLAVSQGGASSPVGSAAGTHTAHMESVTKELAANMSSAVERLRTAKEMEKATSEVKLNQASEEVAKVQKQINTQTARRAKIEADIAKANKPAAIKHAEINKDERVVVSDAILKRLGGVIHGARGAMRILK